MQSLGALAKSAKQERARKVTHIDEKDGFGDAAIHRAARKGSKVRTVLAQC
jgi:hypothetical protein